MIPSCLECFQGEALPLISTGPPIFTENGSQAVISIVSSRQSSSIPRRNHFRLTLVQHVIVLISNYPAVLSLEISSEVLLHSCYLIQLQQRMLGYQKLEIVRTHDACRSHSLTNLKLADNIVIEGIARGNHATQPWPF